MPITINNLPCVAVTDKVAEWLMLIGEDPRRMNRMEWPQGAAQWADGRFVATRAVVDQLYADRGGGANLKLDDSNGGVVEMDGLLFLPPIMLISVQ